MPLQTDVKNVQEAHMETGKVYSIALLVIPGTDQKTLEVPSVQPAREIGLCQDLGNTDAWLVITTAKVRQALPSVLLRLRMGQIVGNGSTPKVMNLCQVIKRTIGHTRITTGNSK